MGPRFAKTHTSQLTIGDILSSTRTILGKCSTCGVETEHDIVAMKSDGIGYCFGLECPVCGKLVPEKAWIQYQRTGDVIVPNLFKGAGNPRPIYKKGSRNYE